MAKYFVSYSSKDNVDGLLDLLGPLFKTSPDIGFQSWRDTGILPGEHWREEIDKALEESDFGLLLLSPEFFASDFIKDVELGPLLAKPAVIPVMLHPILLNGKMKLHGLEQRQIFRDSSHRAFSECRSMADKRKFALELFEKICAALKKAGIC